MRTGEQAIAWGRAQVTDPQQDWYRQCLKFVRSCYGIPAKYADAGKAWDNAAKRHRTSDPMAIPRGVPVFFETPGIADHIVLSLGNGLCLTNDWSAPGKISSARIADIVKGWNAPLLGWTEDLNGVTVYTPQAAKPVSIARPDVHQHLVSRWNNDRTISLHDVSAIEKLTDAKHAKFEDAAYTLHQAVDQAMRAYYKATDTTYPPKR